MFAVLNHTCILSTWSVYLQITRCEMTQWSCKNDTKSKRHPGMKLAPVRVFSCKHPLILTAPLGYVHTIPNSFSCRHEKVSGIVRTRIQYLEIGTVQLRCVTEIETKSTLRSLIWFTGRATVVVQEHKLIKTGLCLPPRANIVHAIQLLFLQLFTINKTTTNNNKMRPA